MKNTVIAIISFVCGFCLMHTCTPKQNEISKIEIQIDTIFKTDTVYIPHYEIVRSIDTVRLATAADTVRILDNYHQLRVYRDTLRDAGFAVFLVDSVFANQIISRSWSGKYYRNTTTITNTEAPSKRWRYGVGAGGLYAQGVFAPAVMLSAEKSKFGIFGIASTSAIGAGVSLKF